MSGLLLRNINKIYPGGQQAIRNLSLEIPKKEFLILAGPDGCGKAALLRMIAGLEEITSGSLYIDGVDMTNAEPRERNIAMIFKNSVLYPDMTVAENLSFSLRMAKMPLDEIEIRITEISELMGLNELLDRKPYELDPRESYRVLIGRALIRHPRILLLDSTLADMDEELQREARQELLDLHRKMDMTVIYVTDNQKTAMVLGSRMVILNDGEICQDDTPENIVNNPASAFVAGIAGYPRMNFFPAVVFEKDKKIGLDFRSGKVILPDEKADLLRERAYIKKEVVVGIRADALSLADGKDAEGTVKAKILKRESDAADLTYRFAVGDGEGVWMPKEMVDLKDGVSAAFSVDAERMQIFDYETEKMIF